MSLLCNGPVDSSLAPESQPPTLICKMGIQLEHSVGEQVYKAVSWHVADKHQSSLFMTQATLCSEETEDAPRPCSYLYSYSSNPKPPNV